MHYNKLSGGLPRELWVVQVGIFVNALGWGAVLPFEVIYLHSGRGFDLAVAGAVIGVVTGLAVVVAPLAGTAIDRAGARLVAVVGGIALAAGYAGLALATRPGPAFAAAVAAGVGNGALQPSQSALLAALAPPQLRHRASAVSRVATNVGFGAGGGLGGLVAAHGLGGLVALFLANALTYLVYVAVLVVAVKKEPPMVRVGGGYRQVLRDRALVAVAVINVAIIGVGWGFFSWVVPPFVHSVLDVGPETIGLVLLANSLTVAVAQLPITRALEGHRRTVAMATGAGIFTASFLLLAATGAMPPTAAVSALFVGSVAVGIGECFHTTAIMPLVADLAPIELRGRYMATLGLTWWVGLALAPTVGGRLLAASPVLALLAAAAVAALAGAASLALGRLLPVGVSRTPRPTPAVPAPA
jgi:MFS family permease